MKRKKLSPPSDSWVPARSVSEEGERFAFSEPRKALISRLETIRESKVLVYIEAAQAPPEALRYLYEHLRTTHRQSHQQLDLVLFTKATGCDDMERAVQAMALLREHAREVKVLLPSISHGLGTCLSIGADGVVMHPLATLGKLEGADAMASTHHFKAWMDAVELSATSRDEAALEFLRAAGPVKIAESLYATSRLGAHLEALVESRVRPQEEQARRLRTLLEDPACPLAHPIERRKAKALGGLPIELPDAETEGALWDLFCAYEHVLGLLSPVLVEAAPTAVIESTETCHAYRPPRQGKRHSAGGWVSLHASELH